MFQKLKKGLIYFSREISTGIVSLLPNDFLSTILRRLVYRLNGFDISRGASVYRNVLLLGRVVIGRGTSISNNTTISGAEAGVYIGADVMIAPGCCIVAFDHGTQVGAGPMINQKLVQAKVIIENDVWIAANCTITKGVTIGEGAIIGANSVVITDIEPYTIAAGVPARKIKSRV